MTYTTNNSDGSSVTVESTSDAVAAIENRDVTGQSAEEASVSLGGDDYVSKTGIAVGEGGFTLARIGATEDVNDKGEPATRLPDGFAFHPDFEAQPLLGGLLILENAQAFQDAGFEKPGIAYAAVGTAVVELKEGNEPGAIFFPERSNLHPEQDEETVDIRTMTYFRLR